MKPYEKRAMQSVTLRRAETGHYIDNRKIKNIVNATERYIMRYDWNGDTRFDVIAVVVNGLKVEIEHIEDAFLPPR